MGAFSIVLCLLSFMSIVYRPSLGRGWRGCQRAQLRGQGRTQAAWRVRAQPKCEEDMPHAVSSRKTGDVFVVLSHRGAQPTERFQ